MAALMKPSLPLEVSLLSYDETIPITKEFEAKIWFGRRICDQVRQADYRGFSGETEKYEVRVYAMAGRVMFTFEEKRTGEWLSLVVLEDADYSTMGLQARTMESNALIAMLTEIIATWPKLNEDRELSIG